MKQSITLRDRVTVYLEFVQTLWKAGQTLEATKVMQDAMNEFKVRPELGSGRGNTGSHRARSHPFNVCVFAQSVFCSIERMHVDIHAWSCLFVSVFDAVRPVVDHAADVLTLTLTPRPTHTHIHTRSYTDPHTGTHTRTCKHRKFFQGNDHVVSMGTCDPTCRVASMF